MDLGDCKSYNVHKISEDGIVRFLVESTAILSDSTSGKGVIYAVFTTPFNGLQASAICAYRLDDIKRVLTRSAFKTQNSPTSVWNPVAAKEVPSPRPGTVRKPSRFFHGIRKSFLFSVWAGFKNIGGRRVEVHSAEFTRG